MEKSGNPIFFSMPLKRRSRRIAGIFQSILSSSNTTSPTSNTEQVPFNFHKLPAELQNEILRIAIEQSKTRRLYCVAPDTKTFKDTPQFKILSKAHPVPACLHVCVNSRRIAQGTYSLWPLQRGGSAWVNKDEDLFYLTDYVERKYPFLSPKVINDYELGLKGFVQERAYQIFKYLRIQLAGVRNIAFSRGLSLQTLFMMEWLLTLPNAVNWTMIIQEGPLESSTSWVLNEILVEDPSNHQLMRFARDSYARWEMEGKHFDRSYIHIARVSPTEQSFKWSG